MDKKRKPLSASSLPPASSSSSQHSLTNIEDLECSSAGYYLQRRPHEVQATVLDGVQMEESAEEVLQASINFKNARSSVASNVRNGATARMLYPSLDATSLDGLLGEEKREETEFLMVGSSALPDVVSVYFEDDDPVTRKLLEEERLMQSVRTGSLMTPKKLAVHVEAEDSKPPAQQVAYASAYQEDDSPDEMNLGVRAELVGESDFTLYHAFPTSSMNAVAMSNDSILTDEAIVLDSKPAALPSRWSNESAEATVLGDSPQNAAVWTTRHTGENYDEIAVTGRDEAEATIVEIAEDIHPADLDSTGVHAELIGRDFSHVASYQGHQSWDISERRAVVSDVTPEYTIARVQNAIADESIQGTVVTFSDDFYLAGRGASNVTAQYVARDYSQSDSLLWTASDQPLVNSVSQVFSAGEEHATVVEITENLHPAELDEPAVQAEFVGRDFSQGDLLVGSQAWAEPVGQQANVLFDDYAVVTATNIDRVGDGSDAEASAVAFAHEMERITPRAEPVGRIVGRAESFPGTPQHAQALLVSPVGISHRAVSAPGCHAPLEYHRNNLTEGLVADANPMNSMYPVKETPPPIPPRSAAGREISYNSNGSQFSMASSNGDTGNGVQQSASSRSASAGSLSNSGELLSQAQRAVTRSRANVLRHTNNVRDRWFGCDPNRTDYDLSHSAGSILSRTLLPWSVFPSETTGMWVATVNTNQKALDSNDIVEASKALRAFSVPTREQAEALARAWAPPRMLPFAKNSRCFICEARFAVFKRPCHCRNCGVCVCSACTVQWPSKMIPDTYNIKQESIVNICKSCDWLCSAFRMALLDGNLEQAVVIHSTNNVNLVTPFANVKGELFYPVHCAVLGGSLELLQWLVDTHCCPLRSIRISGKTRQSSGSFTPILTSRGRSLLGIAIENEKIDLVRYLVVDKGMPLAGEKDLNTSTLIRLLDRILRELPQHNNRELFPSTLPRPGTNSSPGNKTPVTPTPTRLGPVADSGSGQQSEESWRADEALAYELAEQSRREQDSQGSVDDACIICFANSIDCVVTPCGHQICCMQCSTNISRCPVCGVDCCFIKVFRAN